MHLACCQLGMAWEDKPANYRRVETLLDAAGVSAGTLVLLPEMFATGFTMDSENQCYLAAVNRYGRDPSGLASRFAGSSSMSR